MPFEAPQEGRIFNAVRAYPSKPFTSSDTYLALLPWRAPAVMAMLGHVRGTDEPALVIVSEWPWKWMLLSQELDKFTHEQMLVRRLSTDCAIATGHQLFGAILPGSNPPDTVAESPQGPLGVESTALSFQERRDVHDLFAKVRTALSVQDPTRFRKLVGSCVYIWFEEMQGGQARPPKRSDAQAVKKIVEALSDYEPANPELVPAGQMPDTLPELNLAGTDTGAVFYASPLQGGVPTTLLFTALGFEIGLAHSTTMTAGEAWKEVERLITKHDKPGVDLLVLSAAAPDRKGTVFPAESAIVPLLLQIPSPLAEPKHIRRVVVHDWATGTATSIYPNVDPWFGPIYAGNSLAFQPAFANDEPASPAGEGE